MSSSDPPPPPDWGLPPVPGFNPPGGPSRHARARDRRSSFERSVVKALLRVTPEPDRYARQCYQAAQARTGVAELLLRDAYETLGFPLRLLLYTGPVETCTRLNFHFETSALYAQWVEKEEAEPDWGSPGRRGVAFNYVGLGLCVVHDAAWAPACVTSLRLLADVTFGEFFLAPLDRLAKNVNWRLLP